MKNLYQFLLNVNNGYQLLTHKKNWYQFLIHEKNRYQYFTNVRNRFQFLTCLKNLKLSASTNYGIRIECKMQQLLGYFIDVRNTNDCYIKFDYVRISLTCDFVCFVALRPKSTAMVMAGRSVHLTILFFPGQA